MARTDRQRPIPPGVSEASLNETGTSGVWPAHDPEHGDSVRVGAATVYEDGRVIQPSMSDDGDDRNDGVGSPRRSVPLEDGARANAAIRTSYNESQETGQPYGLDGSYGTHVYRRDPSELVGTDVVISARSGEYHNTVTEVGATATLSYDDEEIELHDQVLVDAPCDDGDHGAPVYVEDTGGVVGIVSAITSDGVAVSRIPVIEEEFNIEVVPDPDIPVAGVSLTLTRVDDEGYIRTLVRDRFGRAIEEAAITLDPADGDRDTISGETDESGGWSQTVLVDDYELTVDKDGYDGETIEVHEDDFESDPDASAAGASG